MFDPSNALRKMLGPKIGIKNFGSNKISKDVRSKNSLNYFYPPDVIDDEVIRNSKNQPDYELFKRNKGKWYVYNSDTGYSKIFNTKEEASNYKKVAEKNHKPI